MDRYRLDAAYQSVMLPARELKSSLLPPTAQTWVNQHVLFTHGNGVVMSPVTLSSIEWPKTTISDESVEAAAADAHTAQSFGDRLFSALRRVEAEVRASVSRMMQPLSFSASLMITPKIAPAPAGSATPMRGTAPASSAKPDPHRRTRGLYADYDNGGDLDWV